LDYLTYQCVKDRLKDILLLYFCFCLSN